VVVVDDSVSACSSSRVDAEDFHVQRLGGTADVPSAPGPGGQATEIVTVRRSVRARPARSVAVTCAL
jgi:hypothetical protein